MDYTYNGNPCTETIEWIILIIQYNGNPMYRMDDLEVPTWIGNLMYGNALKIIPRDLMILVMIFRPFMVRSL